MGTSMIDLSRTPSELALSTKWGTGVRLGSLTQHPDVASLLPDGTRPPVVSYRPAFSPLGEYSKPDACQPVIDESWPQVTLHENGEETLWAAYERLRAKGTASGILNVRWDAPPKSCDTLIFVKNKGMSENFVIRGIAGPNGEQPRFYCRTSLRDGNIPYADTAAPALTVGGGRQTVVENLHIDGYRGAMILSMRGHVIVRNNYFHHQMGNTISSSNISTENSSVKLEFCGNEMSHGGWDNAKHIFYVHRGLPESSSVDATWVDNFIHSAGSSNGIKSIANTNTIVNNRLSKQVDTDPSFTRRSSQFVIDVATCSQNLIEGNLIEGPKLELNRGGKDLIGLTNRKTEVNGCDRPKYGSAQWNDPAYWESLKGVPPFKTVIRNNTFRTRPAEFRGTAYDNKLVAVADNGSWPVEGPGFGPNILRNVPPGYFEQHVAEMEGNTYIGPFLQLYNSYNMVHCKPGTEVKGWGICPPAPVPGPTKGANFFDVRGGEKRIGPPK